MLLCAQFAFLPSAFAADAAQYELIGTKEELVKFRDRVNNGETDLNARLTADIDLGGEKWTPIGNDPENDKFYNATFDGSGHTVSGLKVQDPNGNYQGFFGGLYQASVENLTVIGASEGAMAVGGIAGAAESSSINNCIFKGDVTGHAWVGGIVGNNVSSRVMNCAYFGGTVTVVAREGILFNGGLAGGIAGSCGQADPFPTLEKSPLLANCIVSADIKNTNTNATGIGGVAGVANYAIVANCTFVSGSVVSVGNTVGGIVGACNNYYMVNCVFAGSKVAGKEGANDVGGV
ncbi:MAG: GLUG motif-containing protein, partial [Cloacibacillus sp.]